MEGEEVMEDLVLASATAVLSISTVYHAAVGEDLFCKVIMTCGDLRLRFKPCWKPLYAQILMASTEHSVAVVLMFENTEPRRALHILFIVSLATTAAILMYYGQENFPYAAMEAIYQMFLVCFFGIASWVDEFLAKTLITVMN
ncbi:hypothetical protein HELRODRAFT_162067 [Helobdella robusta]|uniref:Uncharacterized protein n=1 Tax=Helobdella robusta TaxID=6412 RepID=T1ES79_HELRO|nr:hypothetical protein HELRODRAFT_162067 [Helobdella robusta]ESN98630.1 hypothetical protein HELRODRAFT_162067 [Helobdella robusta]